jgi:hypothetical protein
VALLCCSIVGPGHWSGELLEDWFVCSGRLPLPRQVIAVAVRRYLRYGLSYRDVENCWESAASRWIT